MQLVTHGKTPGLKLLKSERAILQKAAELLKTLAVVGPGVEFQDTAGTGEDAIRKVLTALAEF